MKRVLIFSLAYYPNFVSGAEVAIKEISDRIDPKEIEFHIITLLFETDALREERIGNVLVHRVGFGGAYLSKIFFVPLAALKARELDRKLRFDALWSMMTYMLFPVVLSRLVGVRAPHILTLQDGDPYEKVFERSFIRPFVPILDYGFRTARLVQVISRYLATWPAKRGYRGEVVLIPNGASLPPAQKYAKEELDALKASVGKQEGEVLLVTVSRLAYKNAVDDIINALTHLPSHIRLLVVGGGEEEAKLKALTRERGLDARVHFTGNVDRTMTAKYRAISDIFLRPSRTEGQGISFLSAMASGIPVVATQEGGIADFLFDAQRNPDVPPTGWAVDKDSPEQIAAAVEDILAHPEKARAAVANALKMVTEDYDWSTIARDMREKVFSPVVGS